jgi:hypothetical protein
MFYIYLLMVILVIVFIGYLIIVKYRETDRALTVYLALCAMGFGSISYHTGSYYRQVKDNSTSLPVCKMAAAKGTDKTKAILYTKKDICDKFTDKEFIDFLNRTSSKEK